MGFVSLEGVSVCIDALAVFLDRWLLRIRLSYSARASRVGTYDTFCLGAGRVDASRALCVRFILFVLCILCILCILRALRAYRLGLVLGLGLGLGVPAASFGSSILGWRRGLRRRGHRRIIARVSDLILFLMLVLRRTFFVAL